jgi:hypothetical protein
MTEIDFAPILNHLIEVAGAVILILGSWLIVRLRAWVDAKTGLANSKAADLIQQRMNEALARSLAYAESAVESKVTKTGKVEVDSPLVAAAAGYLTKMWPELVEASGLTPEAIAEAIIARLPSGPLSEAAQEITIAKAGAAPVKA